MGYKVATIIELKSALEKRCPILLCVPETVPHLSQVFNDEGITDKKLGMKTIKEWVKNYKKGNHAVLRPETWQGFEDIIDKIRRNGLIGKLDIAYEGRAISYTNAMMEFGDSNILDDRWGNGAGAYILYEDEKRRVGMARLFNEGGHYAMKIPYKEQGQKDMQWSDDITSASRVTKSIKKPDAHEFTHSGYTSRAYE